MTDLTIGAPPAPANDPVARAGQSDMAGPLIEDEAPVDELAPLVDESTVRFYLEVFGVSLGATVGREPEHWHFTDSEMDTLAPGLTAYINRHAALRAAVHRGDSATVLVAMGRYLWRNVKIEVAYRISQRDQEPAILDDIEDAGSPQDHRLT